MLYYVSFAVSGVVTIPVDSDSKNIEKIERIAKEEFDKIAFEEMNVVESKIIRTEDDCGNVDINY